MQTNDDNLHILCKKWKTTWTFSVKMQNYTYKMDGCVHIYKKMEENVHIFCKDNKRQSTHSQQNKRWSTHVLCKNIR